MHKILILLAILTSSFLAEEISFEQTIYIKTTKEKLWEALTSPKVASKYYMCPLKEIGEKKGDKIVYGTTQADLISGEILSLKSQKELSHSFKFNMGTDGDKDKTTKVTYLLHEQNGLLELTLIHSSFEKKNESFYNITSGWPFILSNLKTYLETGKTLTEK